MLYTDTQSLMKNLKLIKFSKEITNKELVAKLNCSESAVSGVFKQNTFTIEKLNELCNALDCYIEINIIDRNVNQQLLIDPISNPLNK